MGAIIEIRGVVNRFGRQVVHDGLDADIRAGEVFGIVGGSGSGKSVLLRTMLGLQRPTAGSVRIEGEEVAGRPIAARPAPRRAGDSPKLVADSRALQERFRWQPRYNDLQEITASALAWERRIRQLNTTVAQS